MPQALPAIATAAQSAAAWYSTQAALTQIGIQLAASAALTAGSIALQEQPRSPAIKRDLARPNSLPAYRYVYGRSRAYGSPAPFRVRGNRLYGCLILNSRPSAGGLINVSIDKRRPNVSGDPLNFSGTGCAVTSGALDGYFSYWVGLGAQVAPPSQILSEVPDLFQASDGWRGRTVIWFRANAGGKNNRLKRWPKVAPEIEVEMDWSLVWDPRDPVQDPDDHNTWGWSDNQALCTLDALMRNPIQPYRVAQINIPSWVEAANIADQPVGLKGGGTEPRYRVSGVINWESGELEASIEPLILAGAGGVSRVGGKLYAIPGAWTAPEVTITDAALDGEMSVEALQPGDDVYSGVRTTYVNTGRDWQSADAGVYRVPGAQAADGGIEKIRTVDLAMVTSPTQAQRIGKYLALVGRKQRQIDTTFPPSAFSAIAGGTVNLALPEPLSVVNGVYEVLSINPGLAPVGDSDGVAMRCPATLREASPDVWDWSPALDEQDVFETVEFDGERLSLAQPGSITAVSGSAAALGSGSSAPPRIMFSFDPADSDRVDRYDIEYRLSGGTWQDGGSIDADRRNSSGDVFGYVVPVEVGQSYDVRARSRAGNGDVSDWVTYSGIVALPPSVTMTAPTNGSATPGASGVISVKFKTPNADDVRGIQFWTSGIDDSGTASAISPGTIYSGPSQTIEIEHTGLTSGVARYYWARTVGPYGALSGFSGSVSAIAP